MTGGRSRGDIVLEVSDLRKEFGGITALDGVNVSIDEGQIVGIVGPNGAGKSTLFNCIMGVYEPTAGRISLRGEEITGNRPSAIVQQGLSRAFQQARVFPELTVRENMIVNQQHADERLLLTLVTTTDPEVESRIEELLDFVGLSDHADKPGGALSGGQKKLLNLAGTLLRDPDIVLLDEPTAGVAPSLVDEITQLVGELHEGGQTFLIIEHDMDVIRSIAEHLYVLASGTNLTEGPPEEALADPEVLEAYFGE